MIDFGRTYCDLHPSELISNFCCREECNIALCATCICSHTENHIQRRTAPDYENIRTTYSKMQEQIRTRITALEHQKLRINQLVQHLQSNKKNTNDTIQQAKLQTLDFVNRFFEAKEKEITRKIQAEQKKQGLHNENRMDCLSNTISRGINSLFSAAQDLNSANFLESFHRIRTQVLTNSLITQKEIAEELDKNQNYDVTLTVNPLFINDIQSALEKSLMFCWEEKKLAPKIVEAKEENISKSSRIHINPNQNSAVTLVQRRPQSMPKQSSSSHPSRGTSGLLQQCNPMVFLKQQQGQFQYQQMQPQSLLQPVQYQSQSQYQHQQVQQPNTYIVKLQGHPHLSNYSTSLPQNKPLFSSNSRSQLRMNSSQKNIKQNGFARNHLSQSFMGNNLNLSTNDGHLEATKKIRRSGLTVLRNVDNQSKH